jgi:hypothetical protein
MMPVHKEGSGYQWGNSGKVYPTKEQANKQAQAAYANGYKGKSKAMADGLRKDQ